MDIPRAGIDVGGTFTDLALWDGARLVTAKVSTTPSDQSEGVVDALRRGGRTGVGLVHGTTVATNTLLERSGARTVLITDSGFEGLIEIGRQDRPSLYDLSATRPTPLVDPASRIGVEGRTWSDGSSTPWDVAAVVAAVADLEPESVAISTLFSFAAPARERELRRVLSNALPSVSFSLSSDVAPEFREYERMSTTVINAYLAPVVSRYLEELGPAVAAEGVVGAPAVMRSSGGLTGLRSASTLPSSIVLSGPAGGVVAAAALGSALGYSALVSFDMGGTSTDVCLVRDGRPDIAFEQSIGGLPNRMPAVAVHTVGAGGGSIGWADPGGALRVGPRSAGAVPGPAAYGRGGTEPTVTDANLVIGRLGTGSTLGLDVVLDESRSRSALSALGERLGLTADETAVGMVDVVESHMGRAVRAVSVDHGEDPRQAVLVAFGGAGAMHATALARRLDMAGVAIPPHAGVFSALGLLLAPPRMDVVKGVLLTEASHLDALLAEVRSRADVGLRDAGSEAHRVESSVDARYRGQAHETSVPLSPREGWKVLESRFHAAHARRNGFSRPDDPIEVVAVRAVATGAATLEMSDILLPVPSGEPRRAGRQVRTGTETVAADVWWRPGLTPGDEVIGPAVIEEPEATTYLDEGERAIVHESGALEVSW